MQRDGSCFFYTILGPPVSPLSPDRPLSRSMPAARPRGALVSGRPRRVPQGGASLKAGRWERKRFVGVELRGETLGVIGLGRIGRVVASRAAGFEMKVVAFDQIGRASCRERV